MATQSFARFGGLGLYTETALHCGAESGAGYVDLPIQRERHTQYPVIPGSTLKGVLRDELKADLESAGVERVFGKEDASSPGTIAFQDGILVAFPVRSSGAPFRWVTSPFALNRVLRAMGRPDNVPSPKLSEAWASAKASEISLEEVVVSLEAKPALFEDKVASPLGALKSLLPAAASHFAYIHEILPTHLVIVHDDILKELVETGTEVVTRIKLNSVGTTARVSDTDSGNLFVEELVPPDALFFAPLRAPGKADESFVQAIQNRKLIRLGGDETIGRGVTHLTYVNLGE